MSRQDLLEGKQVVGIVCNQWGDTGKGMVVDSFADWADVIERGTGGNNAGHTTIVNGQKRIFHLIPAGITRDCEGKINVLGGGMVLDLEVLCSELDDLDREKISYNNLMISEDAQVIMPYHVMRDQRKNQSQANGGIGSTGRGIGPCYADATARTGPKIRDLFNRDAYFARLRKSLPLHTDVYPELFGLKGKGLERRVDDIAESILVRLQPFIERIKPHVRDTMLEVDRFLKQGKKILLEGAQGLLLSNRYGTDPYITSSDCSAGGTALGAGLTPDHIHTLGDRYITLGIVKFPFMTRVGAGPFPSELGQQASEEWCAVGNGKEHDIFDEAVKSLEYDCDLEEIRRLENSREATDQALLGEYHRKVREHISNNRERVLELIHHLDSFIKGIGIRLAGMEYGATTGRPRRTGWTDAVAARYARKINGPLMILTKPNCLDGCDEFRVCYEYEIDGQRTEEFSRDSDLLRRAQPVYKTYRGYDGSFGVQNYDQLPIELTDAFEDFEEFTRGKVIGVSVGPERGQLVFKD